MRTGAAVGAVGDASDFGGSEGLDQAVFAGCASTWVRCCSARVAPNLAW
jgi:hypothetical protein